MHFILIIIILLIVIVDYMIKYFFLEADKGNYFFGDDYTAKNI